MLKWFGTACAAGLALVLSGCAGSSATPERAEPVKAGTAARRDQLLAKGTLTGVEALELAEMQLADRSFIAAEATYWSALTRGLDARGAWRARMGLGKCDESRLQWASAAIHYAEAANAAVPPVDRDAARAAQALAEFRGGNVDRARKTRAAIVVTSAKGVSELDRLLGGTAKVAPIPEAPAGVRTGTLAVRPKGTGRQTPPKIVTRSEWRATPTIIRRTEPMGQPNRLTLHHTADVKPVGTSFADVAERMRAYQNGHNGAGHFWADIGYHFVVDKQGRIWEGRPMAYQGAHAGSDAANAENIGIALIGNFEKEKPTAAQMKATTDLVVWLASEYRIGAARVYGHEDLKKMYRLKGTKCPGDNFDPYLKRLRDAVGR